MHIHSGPRQTSTNVIFQIMFGSDMVFYMEYVLTSRPCLFVTAKILVVRFP